MSDVTLQQKLDLAGQLHRAGKLGEAEKTYREILAASPNQPDVMHLLGVIRFQLGNPGEGLELIGRALAINPRHAVYHCNLGVILSQEGNTPRPIRIFARRSRCGRIISSRISISPTDCGTWGGG